MSEVRYLRQEGFNSLHVFTLYVAVALVNSSTNSEKRLFELVKRVSGWGRIQCVERLAETRDPAIQAWLLREGWRNTILEKYSAYTCATTGDLLGALERESVDGDLLLGAGEIIAALMEDGPAKGMDDYEDGALAVERYLQHLGTEPRDLRHLEVLDTIGHSLAAGDWSEHAARAWTPDLRTRLADSVRERKRLPYWPELIDRGLRSDEGSDFYTAEHAARILGIDAWEATFARLDGGQDDAWYLVMHTDDAERIDRVVALAEQRIALDEIATGPARELGIGPQWCEHRNLDFVLQELRRFPGKGWSLIRTGIRSPVTRSRRMALRALSPWGKAGWPEEAETVLARALIEEPDRKVRQELETLLEGGEIEIPR